MVTLESVGRKSWTIYRQEPRNNLLIVQSQESFVRHHSFLEADSRRFIYGKKSQIAIWKFLG